MEAVALLFSNLESRLLPATKAVRMLIHVLLCEHPLPHGYPPLIIDKDERWFGIAFIHDYDPVSCGSKEPYHSLLRLCRIMDRRHAQVKMQASARGYMRQISVEFAGCPRQRMFPCFVNCKLGLGLILGD